MSDETRKVLAATGTTLLGFAGGVALYWTIASDPALGVPIVAGIGGLCIAAARWWPR